MELTTATPRLTTTPVSLAHPSLGRRSRATHESRHRPRALAVRAWALAQGESTDARSVAWLLDALDAEARSPCSWTTERVFDFVWGSGSRHAAAAGAGPGTAGLDALWLWLRYLDATDGFEPGSDPLDDLERTLAEWGCLVRPRTRRLRSPRAG